MREEQTLAEIENYLEGFNQPTYRGMRIDDHRVATWSSQHGWSGIVGRMRSGYSEPLRVECAYAGTGNHRRYGRDNECSNRHQGYPALAVDSYRSLSRRVSLCPSTQRRGSAGGAKVCHSRGRCIHHPCRVPPRKSCYLSDQQVSRRPGGATDISPDANNPTILVVSHSAE